MSELEHTIGLAFNKQSPKRNAPEYRIKTMADLFATLTPENMDRFLSEFSDAMKAAVQLREVIRPIVELSEQVPEDVKKLLQLDEFVWIDD